MTPERAVGLAVLVAVIVAAAVLLANCGGSPDASDNADTAEPLIDRECGRFVIGTDWGGGTVTDGTLIAAGKRLEDAALALDVSLRTSADPWDWDYHFFVVNGEFRWYWMTAAEADDACRDVPEGDDVSEAVDLIYDHTEVMRRAYDDIRAACVLLLPEGGWPDEPECQMFLEDTGSPYVAHCLAAWNYDPNHQLHNCARPSWYPDRPG